MNCRDNRFISYFINCIGILSGKIGVDKIKEE